MKQRRNRLGRQNRADHRSSFQQTIPFFPDPGGLRLVDARTGAEIRPGATIPEPYGRGQITYLGPTVHTDADESRELRPGRVAVVRYASPETDWLFLPEQIGARYEDDPQLP